MKLFLTLSLVILSFNSLAQVLVLKKNVNPQNVLHFNAQVENCRIVDPAVQAQWLMGSKGGKVEGLNSVERPLLSPQVLKNKGTEAEFTFGAIEEHNSALPDNRITIRMEKCQPRAYINTDRGEMQLTEIYAHLGGMLNNKLRYMQLTGKDSSGKPVSIRLDP
jgi:hypothetical protein